MNDRGFQDLLKSKFKIGADAAAAAGPVGRNAAAATDVKLNAELLTYSRSKGLFVGVDLKGAVVLQSTDDTNVFYEGHADSFEHILQGKVPVPVTARPFILATRRYFRAAHTD